ncbi:MAG: indole-3-glycerol phosphate synthase TrpC [Candidatus Omnitrophica bacterium]|nr:indole-3-glycerol phosphate synthase TrpC [Candidatus Omnitrophota bacterium]MDD5771053.1 indole-3-glycerol phosphate synthase TrpC [Candidatus Omnitrophota bacterium]
MAKTDTLKEIVAKKKEKMILRKQQLPEEELKAKVAGLAACRPFKEAISKPRQISLIAEIKQSSPSKGVIRKNFNLQEIARSYQEAGVQAVSVLTEEDFFAGRSDYIGEVKNIVTAPVLRKDFILEPYQIYESRYLGADAVLLIADLLSKDKLVEFMQIADSLDMDYLVEVHDEKELKKVLSLKVPVIGINNRNLHTLEVDFKTTEKLFTLIPRDKIVVVESGIKSYQDILFLKILGSSAVLIGTAFMEAEDIKMKVEEIMGW